MCVIFLAWQATPKYRLVVAANRDEFYRRPTAPAAYWDDDQILAGRDEKAGGTWLGVNRRGEFAAITNYRHPAEMLPKARSRGALVSGFLEAKHTPDEYIASIASHDSEHAGYNLLLGSRDSLHWTSNRGGTQSLPSGVHGLSNAQLNTPWPKVERGKQLLTRLLAEGDFSIDDGLALLADRHQPTDDALPNTGVGKAMERLVAPTFIASAMYGTRASTVLMIGHDGLVQFHERRFGPQGALMGDSAFEFRIDG